MQIDQFILEFCHKLAKIELHAHLNGCARLSTLRELAVAQGLEDLPPIIAASDTPPHVHSGDAAAVELNKHSNGSTPNTGLWAYWRGFALIHKLANSLEVIRRITREAIEDFARDNVVYLELRTTPRHRPHDGITKSSYVDAVFEGIEEYYNANRNAAIDVRLLLSIDRKESQDAALDTANLALSLAKSHPQGFRIVGLDLGGDPAIGNWDNWRPAMELARQGGLKVSLHCAELWHEEETAAMLKWRPDRLGHMICVKEDLHDELLQSSIPVEICLTSNICTKSVPSYEEHHFIGLYRKSHPVILCTDDPSECMFNTTMTREYAIAAHTFGLSKKELATLAVEAVEAVFLNEEEKEALRKKIKEKHRSTVFL